MNGYRFSIIPAAAVTDEALEPRDLQVLCLIGRHTDRNGWCRRSQVKMADELRCGRATVQRALERLYDARYLQRRLEGTRRGVAPAEGEQPFRAHSYRVLMDRDAAADELAKVGEGVPADEHPEVLTYGQVVPAIDGHGVPTHARAPTKGPSSKGTPLNSQSGASAETGNESEPVKDSAVEYLIGSSSEPIPTATLTDFHATWGMSAIDNVNRTMRAFGALTPDERRAAVDGIKPFRAEMERNKRTHPIAGWRYLEERRWTFLPPAQSSTTQDVSCIKSLSRDWWAVLLNKIDRGEKIGFFLKHTLDAFQPWIGTQADMPTLAMVSKLGAYPSDGEVARAWDPWLRSHGVRLPTRDALWIFLPSPTPPDARGRRAA